MSIDNVLRTSRGNVDFVAAMLEAEARFLVVGGLAVSFYCPEREVDDLDLLIEPTMSNAKLVLGALSRFVPSHGLFPKQLGDLGKHISLKPHLNGDLLTPTKTYPSFESMWASSVPARLAHLEVRLPSRQSLLAMKREASDSDDDEVSRAKDARDVMSLEKQER